ncbi:MAG: nitroreductase family protein, partial [Candidatus Omnitrophica bacterium]|nr:nitroreductase family protein [Candidatus Omnitrophota bacterium]
MKRIFIVLSLIIVATLFSAENEPKKILLPKPQIADGKPLMEALSLRKSTREFADREIPAQTLSNLLWAAFGINRPESGKRTAPSASNWQEIDIYVATAKAVYLYDAKANSLNVVVEEDLRGYSGRQAFVKSAPVVLAFVAD